MKVTWNTKSKHGFVPLEDRRACHCLYFVRDPGLTREYKDSFLCSGGGVFPPCKNYEECSGEPAPQFSDSGRVPLSELRAVVDTQRENKVQVGNHSWGSARSLREEIRDFLDREIPKSVSEIRAAFPDSQSSVVRNALARLKLRFEATNVRVGWWIRIGRET